MLARPEVHLLYLLMGGKARNGIVRWEPGRPGLEGVFHLPRVAEILDLAEASNASPRMPMRWCSAVGLRSWPHLCFSAGRSASAADLQLLSSRLITFYGQHEHRRLIHSPRS